MRAHPFLPAAFAFLCLTGAPVIGRADDVPELLRQLRDASPIPPYDASRGTDAGGPVKLVRFDVATRTTTLHPVSTVANEAGSRVAAPRPPAVMRASDGSIVDFAPDPSRREIVNTPAVHEVTWNPVQFPQNTFPFGSIHQMLMRWGNEYFECSATAIGSFHILTAANCIYDSTRGGFPDEIWVWAGQSNSIGPFTALPNPGLQGLLDPWPEHPYGEARVTRYWTYDAFTQFGDANFNVAYLALNRRDGDHTGWIGREVNVETAGLNWAGYPRSITQFDYFMIHGFDADNVAAYTPTNIILAALFFPGMNGGPVWRFDTVSHFLQGWNSNLIQGNIPAPLRLTNNFFNDIDNAIASDEVNFPPTPRPDLVEYLFDGDNAKDINDSAIGPHVLLPGDPFGLRFNFVNTGFAPTGAITVDFYLSTNNHINSSDTFLGSRQFPAGLDAFTHISPYPTQTLTVPTGTPPGVYYAGWIMRCTALEYSTSNNTAVVDVIDGESEVIVVPDVPSICLNSVVLPPQGASFDFATTGLLDTEKGTCHNSGSPELVFQWTPNTTGPATISTCGGVSNYDTVLYVRTVNCQTGPQLACNDNFCGLQSQINTSVVAGQTYFIFVDGNGGAAGNFTLTVTPPPAPTTLDLDLAHVSGNLGMDFDIATTEPVTWNVSLALQNDFFPLFSSPLPVIASVLNVPIGFPFPAVGNVGVLSTFTTADGIAALAWKTADTAPPTTATCSLDVTAAFNSGILSMDFAIVSLQPATLNAYLLIGNNVTRMFSAPLGVTLPTSFTIPIPGFPDVGTIGVLATFSTPTEGIICSDLDTTDTGP